MITTENESANNGLHLTPEAWNALIDAYKVQTDDLRTIKNIIYTLLTKIGFINENGEVREVISMKMLMDIAMKATTQNKKFKEDMGFLADALPLIEKYKDL
jgi:hypothetical protein